MRMSKHPFTVEKRIIPVGRHSIRLLILRPSVRSSEKVPGVLWVHGGGYQSGSAKAVFVTRALSLTVKYGAVLVAPEYRLSGKHPYPAALHDCYTALLYLKEHAEELGVRSDQIMVGGESAGGGLCAAVCMMARDRGIQVAFHFPLYPMLNNLDTESSRDNHGRIWNTRRNHLGWRLYLRGDAKKETVSPYASPSRQTDYSNLPPCYTFVGEGEPFYAETLQYVEDLRSAGVPAEADVYPTNVHAFDMLYPEDAVSRQAISAFEQRFGDAIKKCETSAN